MATERFVVDSTATAAGPTRHQHPLVIRIRACNGLWLGVVPDGSLSFLPPSQNHLRGSFLLEPRASTRRYTLSSMLHNNRAVVMNGTKLRLGEHGTRPADVNLRFDASGRAALIFCESQLQPMMLSSRRGTCCCTESSSAHHRTGAALPPHLSKWNLFSILEEQPCGRRGFLRLPVRVHLRGQNGRYLCSGATVIREVTQVPCCCDQFVLDLPTAHSRHVGTSHGAGAPGCRLWTRDCRKLVTREPDGMILTVGQHVCYGREHLSVTALRGGGLHLSWQLPPQPSPSAPGSNGSALAGAVGQEDVDRSGRRAAKPLRVTPEVTPGSAVLILTHHGQLLSAPATLSSSDRHSSRTAGSEEAVHVSVSPFPSHPTACAWTLQHHGDCVYSIHCGQGPQHSDTGESYPAAISPDSRFLFVDGGAPMGGGGLPALTSSPAVAFPSPFSLFELRVRSVEAPAVGNAAATVVVGFTIRTVCSIQGSQRYLSAEPNGQLTATRTEAGTWELFSLVDIEALGGCPVPELIRPTALVAAAPQSWQQEKRVVQSMVCSVAALCLRDGGGGLDGRGGLEATHSPHLAGERRARRDQCQAMSGWGVTSPAPLRDICFRAVLRACCGGVRSCGGIRSHQASLSAALDSTRDLGLPEDLHEDLVASWRPRLSASQADAPCTRLLPREAAALPDPAMDVGDPRRLVDSFFQCEQCGRPHLPMDPRVNSLHHLHLDWLRRQAYRARGIQLRRHHPHAAGRLRAAATLSVFLGCGILAALRGGQRRRPRGTAGGALQAAVEPPQAPRGFLLRAWSALGTWASLLAPSNYDPWLSWARSAAFSALSALPGGGG